MQASQNIQWRNAPAMRNAQAVTTAVAGMASVLSLSAFFYSGASSSTLGILKFSMIVGTLASSLGTLACLTKNSNKDQVNLLKMSILCGVVAMLVGAFYLKGYKDAIVPAFTALCSVVLLAVLALILRPTPSVAGDLSLGRRGGAIRANGLRPLEKLIPVESDVSVGMHLKYESFDVPKVTWTNNFVGLIPLQVKVRSACLDIHGPWFKREENDPLPQNAPNGILLTGDPGNGKSFIAECIAGSYGYPLFTMTANEFSSQWVGEGNRALGVAFELVKRNCPCVLFIDEIDSFVSSRSGRSGSSVDQEATKMVNIFLTELVALRRFPVIIIGATNHEDKLDAAVKREGRFDYKIQVDNPDQDARVHMLTQSLKKSVPNAHVNWEEVSRTAARFNGFNAKRIMTIGERMPSVLQKSRKNTVGRNELMTALRDIQGTMGRIPENALPMSEIVLPKQTREQVENLLNDFKMVAELEEFGGDMVRGVLFYGPPGTGKTTVAKTVAKESDWGFLSTTGPDLVADREKLQAIYDKAKSLRPCVIFIDEADQVLKDRSMSQYPEVTNKLLTLMEGIDDVVKDVVFIAATNHPEEIDPALLRTGRFTGKVQFANPGVAELEQLVRIWFKKRKDKVEMDTEVNLSELLEQGGFSQANAQGILQTALNNAIRGKSIAHGKAVISAIHIQKALEFIQP